VPEDDNARRGASRPDVQNRTMENLNRPFPSSLVPPHDGGNLRPAGSPAQSTPPAARQVQGAAARRDYRDLAITDLADENVALGDEVVALRELVRAQMVFVGWLTNTAAIARLRLRDVLGAYEDGDDKNTPWVTRLARERLAILRAWQRVSAQRQERVA
jgi:hypothetical protein